VPLGPARRDLMESVDFRMTLSSEFFNAWSFSSGTPAQRATKDVPMLLEMFRGPMDLIDRYNIHTAKACLFWSSGTARYSK